MRTASKRPFEMRGSEACTGDCCPRSMAWLWAKLSNSLYVVCCVKGQALICVVSPGFSIYISLPLTYWLRISLPRAGEWLLARQTDEPERESGSVRSSNGRRLCGCQQCPPGESNWSHQDPVPSGRWAWIKASSQVLECCSHFGPPGSL